jgi:hypothetical protein
MAGGTSIWASKDARTDPKQIFNTRLLYLVITISWAGCFYGFDSGNIGGILTLNSFENAFGLKHLDKAELANRKVSCHNKSYAFIATNSTRAQSLPC